MYRTTREERSDAMTISTTVQMMQRCIGEGSFAAVALRIADCLRLAAAPSYAVMALVTGILGESPKDVLCVATHHASLPSGMSWMYMLMSVFHSAPWLKLIANWASAGRWS
jgi:hypothetical protein